MRSGVTLYISVLFTIAFSINAAAQCHVKKTKSGKITVAENPEYYTYKRTDSTYNGISIHALYSNQTGIKKYELIIFYTSNTRDTVNKIDFKALDQTTVTMDLTLLGLKKNDNKKQNSKVYQLALTDEQIKYLTGNKLQSVSIINSSLNTAVTLDIPESNFLADQLSCLLNN